MLRIESKARARALQLLYAWESASSGEPITETARKAIRVSTGTGKELERAEQLARAVAARRNELDAEIASASDNWRIERVGIVDRLILRIGLYELIETDVPAPVVIDEALRLAHWFGGAKTPRFVNGVLDALAREHKRL